MTKATLSACRAFVHGIRFPKLAGKALPPHSNSPSCSAPVLPKELFCRYAPVVTAEKVQWFAGCGAKEQNHRPFDCSSPFWFNPSWCGCRRLREQGNILDPLRYIPLTEYLWLSFKKPLRSDTYLSEIAEKPRIGTLLSRVVGLMVLFLLTGCAS